MMDIQEQDSTDHAARPAVSHAFPDQQLPLMLLEQQNKEKLGSSQLEQELVLPAAITIDQNTLETFPGKPMEGYYQMELELLEQQGKEKLERMREEQDGGRRAPLKQEENESSLQPSSSRSLEFRPFAKEGEQGVRKTTMLSKDTNLSPIGSSGRCHPSYFPLFRTRLIFFSLGLVFEVPSSFIFPRRFISLVVFLRAHSWH